MSEMFSMQVVLDEADLTPFSFKGPKGEDLELPHASTLTPRQALRVDRGELEAVLTEVAPDVADVVLDAPAFVAEKLLHAWLAHAGMAPGESPASRSSSTSTARPSKQTSRGTTRRR